MSNTPIAIAFVHEEQRPIAHALAASLKLPLTTLETTDYSLLLTLTPERLELRYLGKPKLNPIYVDFTAGKSAHRHQYGGGRGQLIARAVGLSTYKQPTILDLTAGLGQDAFVLASLGCDVTMIERSPILHALLNDGIERASEHAWFQSIALSLTNAQASTYLDTLTIDTQPDVIYLDPMFPHSKKSALVKKEMRVLRMIVGDDPDAKDLLPLCINKAHRRTVVKRPRHAPRLTEDQADIVYEGKSSRYDVYLPKNQRQLDFH